MTEAITKLESQHGNLTVNTDQRIQTSANVTVTCVSIDST
ncbi:hypothetical protein EC950083_2917, partial [Escherichia coli 95.0083]